MPCPASRVTLVRTEIMKIELTDHVRVSPDAMLQVVDGESVILDLESEQYFGLDEVGTRIWQLIGEHGLLRDVHAAMLEEYEVQAQALEQDLLELVSALAEQGLVAVDGAAAESDVCSDVL